MWRAFYASDLQEREKQERFDTLLIRAIKGILAEGAIALPVTLSGGVLFAN